VSKGRGEEEAVWSDGGCKARTRAHPVRLGIAEGPAGDAMHAKRHRPGGGGPSSDSPPLDLGRGEGGGTSAEGKG
jgi:hypothetical protein